MPSADQVRALLARHPMRSPRRAMLMLPVALLALGLLLVIGIRQAEIVGLIFLLGLIALVVVVRYRIKMLRLADEHSIQAAEMVATGRYLEALEWVWRRLKSTVALPLSYGRMVFEAGRALQALGQHEAAMVAFDFILRLFERRTWPAVRTRILRIGSLLAHEYLSDADDELNILRSTLESLKADEDGKQTIPETELEWAWASYECLRLNQQVRTLHYRDVLKLDDQAWLTRLHKMGHESAFGYGLIALAALSLGKHQEDSAEAEITDCRTIAQRWWKRATTLMAPESLMEREPLIAGVHEALEAQPSPIGGDR
ncbi:MAG: hypothetical protein JJU36_16380 [Phycisphaeraceae bacterium]|nr:hypothetical protein [Phycisphaeraceae bacterium]